jgi:hypothetical protein
MIRCAAVLLSLAALAAAVPAQVPRLFPRPPPARRAGRRATAGRAAQRQAGAAGAWRAHPQRRNRFEVIGALAGRKLVVHYTLDPAGNCWTSGS